jgi:hypothetical protein
MRKLLLLLGILPLACLSQGLVRSSIINPNDTVYHLEVWHMNLDSTHRLQSVHPFRISTVTYFLPGDYILGYYLGDTLLHAERLRVSRSPTVLEKRVLGRRAPMSSVTFVKPRKKNSSERYLEW